MQHRGSVTLLIKINAKLKVYLRSSYGIQDVVGNELWNDASVNIEKGFWRLGISASAPKMTKLFSCKQKVIEKKKKIKGE